MRPAYRSGAGRSVSRRRWLCSGRRPPARRSTTTAAHSRSRSARWRCPTRRPPRSGSAASSRTPSAGLCGSGTASSSAGAGRRTAARWGRPPPRPPPRAARVPKRFPIAALVYACFDRDPAQATRTMTEYITGYYGRMIFDPGTNAICGGPREAVARLEDYAALDVDTVVVVPVTRDPEQVDRLAEGVAAFRQDTK